MKQKIFFRKNRWTKSALRVTAFHEAGHAVAAWHFGIHCWAQIVPARDRNKFNVAGECHVDIISALATPFRKAVVDWAGPIAGWVSTGDMTLDDFISGLPWAMEQINGAPSCQGDADNIFNAGFGYNSRPSRIAAGIVKRRYSEICLAAEILQKTKFLESKIKVDASYKTKTVEELLAAVRFRAGWRLTI